MKTLVDTIGTTSVDAVFQTYLSLPVVNSDSDSFLSSGSESSVMPVQKARKTKRKRKALDATDKFERRKMQNRRAAQTSREKKKKYVDNLEKKSVELEVENSSLQAQIHQLLKENALMKKRLPPPAFPTPTTTTTTAASSQQLSTFSTSTQIVKPEPVPMPLLPQALPTTPCLASESAVLQLPQQPEASKESNVALQAAVQHFVTICFMIMCAMSNNPTSYTSTKNKLKSLSMPSLSNRAFLSPANATITTASCPSTSCSHNQTRVSLESHRNALSSDHSRTQLQRSALSSDHPRTQ